MTTVAISDFRAQMSTFLKKVQAGEIISLTLRGEEVARLMPPKTVQNLAKERLEEIRQSAVINDVLSPVDADWNANGE